MGRETARRLSARGYQVLVTDLNEASAEETAVQIGGGAWAMAQDVSDPDSHRAVAKAAAERGPLKVWVNNAGVLRTEKAWDHPDGDDALSRLISVLTQAAERTGDAEEKSRLRRAADALIALGGQVGAGVMTAYLTGMLPNN